MNNISNLIKTLEKCHTNKYALIYQWVRRDHISFNEFETLLKWIQEDNQRQIDYDTWD